MKELLEIFNVEELSLEARIKIINKMINVLNDQVGANIYDEVAHELCNALDDRIQDRNKLSF